MAGVRGPCPVCSSIIEAPQPAVSAATPTPPVAPPQGLPSYPQAPQQQYAPHYQPQAPQQQYAPPHQPQAPQQQYAPPHQPQAPQQQYAPAQQLQPPAPQQTVLPPPRVPQNTNSLVIKVEPRGNRLKSTETPEAIGRPISEQHLAEHSSGPHYRPAPAGGKKIPSRLLISTCVLLLMVAVSTGLVLFMREEPPAPPMPNPVPANRPAPVDGGSPVAVPEKPTAPEPAKPQVAPEPPAPTKPPGPNPGEAAMETVEKFLAASNLEDRLPLIDTKTPASALKDSVLAKPFPANPRIFPDIQETNPDNGSTDFYYYVDLNDASGKPSPQILLVRSPAGGGTPKIVVDPFLDTYGGRLAAFAEKPSEQIATFQLVVSAVAQTTADRNIPNHENKLRLKLMPRDNEKEITSAYFTKGSKLGQMLVTEGSGFRYGQPRTARVALRWNKEEAPESPYLEVTDIKEFRWDP